MHRGEWTNKYTPGKRKREREREERYTRCEIYLLDGDVCVCVCASVGGGGRRERERERERERTHNVAHLSCDLTWKIGEIECLIIMVPFLQNTHTHMHTHTEQLIEREQGFIE